MQNNENMDEVEQNPVIIEIKKGAGYENISDAEALKIYEDLNEISILFYNAFERSRK